MNTRDCVKREKVCFVLFSSSSSLLACFSWFFSLFVRVLPLLDGSEGYTTLWSWQVFLDARYVGVSYVVTPYLYWSTHTSAEDEEEDDDDG